MTSPQEESYGEIPLTQGQVAVIDADNFEWLNQWKWCAVWKKHTQSFYAYRQDCSTRKGARIGIHMHRLILGLSPDDPRQGDHIDPSRTLLNVRSNLRIASDGENKRNKRRLRNNTSGFKGVTWHKRMKRWIAKITLNYRTIHLGVFPTAELAAEAYRNAAPKYHGTFSRVE